MTPSIRRYFLLALLLRLLVAPWFYHPDIKSQHFHFQFLSKGVTNIYAHISANQSHLPYTDTFNYLPLTYYIFGATQIILKPILPTGFSAWINDWSQFQYHNPNLPVFLLILKLPYLFFDLLIAYLLYKMFSQTKFFLFWLFNPMVFYLVYVLGNFDILPSALTLLSLFLIVKNRHFGAGLVFGVGAATKLYPLIFLPPIILTLLSSPKNLAKYLLGILTPLLITLMPFVSSTDFWNSFFGSGLTQKIMALKLGMVPIFPAFYLLVIFLFRHRSLSFQFSLIGLLFLATVNFHPQWLLWFLPFMTISLTSSRFSLSVFALSQILFLAYVVLFNDQFLFWGHLIPVSPLFLSLTTPYDLIRLRLATDPTIYQSILKYTFGIILFILAIYHRKNDPASGA